MISLQSYSPVDLCLINHWPKIYYDQLNRNWLHSDLDAYSGDYNRSSDTIYYNIVQHWFVFLACL